MQMGPDGMLIEPLPEEEYPPFSRRKLLRRLTGVVVAGTTLSGLIGCALASSATPLTTLYPGLAGQFGSVLDLGEKKQFPAALPDSCKLDRAGVFYSSAARTFIVHLDQNTSYLLKGSAFANQSSLEALVHDTDDNSYWLALYQRCVHRSTILRFRNECGSFKCPTHGTHYHCDGEYLDGPGPRSMDRFPLSFQGDHLLVDTGKLLMVARPTDTTRLLPLQLPACSSD